MIMFGKDFNEYIENLALKEIFYDAVMIIDGEGVVRHVRVWHDNLATFMINEAVGKHILEVYVDIQAEESTVLNALKGVSTFNRKTTQTAYNGQTCIFIENTIPLKLEGRIVGAVSFAKFMSSCRQDVSIEDRALKGKKEFYDLTDIIGESLPIQRLKEQILHVSRTNSPVLIFGETGTGKELVAQSIHSASDRKFGRFVSQNCSAIPDNLLEGLLFGTVRGSFTGAENKPGVFEFANGGTIFLDEINSMNMPMQAKILKVIEEKKVRRLGSDKEIPVDIRILSAMNEEPRQCVRRGGIREDLYYRLSAVELKLPSIRERKKDIPLLVDHFISFYNHEMHKSVKGVSDQVMNILLNCELPGNVRELRNIIEGAMNFIDYGYITENYLPRFMLSDVPRSEQNIIAEGKNLGGTIGFDRESGGDLLGYTLTEDMELYEKACIEQKMEGVSSLNQLALRLGISRQSLSYKLKKYGIKLP